MKHWFLDTNVVMDFLANRQPFVDDADTLFRLGYTQRVRLYVASLSFSHIFYLLRRSHGADAARQMLIDLKRLAHVVAVDESVIEQSLHADFPDFEDALQHFAANAVPTIEAIITRDPKGFRLSTLPVLTPAEALKQLAQADS